jgi:hypothetical protein
MTYPYDFESAAISAILFERNTSAQLTGNGFSCKAKHV